MPLREGVFLYEKEKDLYDKKLNRNSVSRKLSSVRSFYNYLYSMDVIDKNYFNDIRNQITNRYDCRFNNRLCNWIYEKRR